MTLSSMAGRTRWPDYHNVCNWPVQSGHVDHKERTEVMKPSNLHSNNLNESKY